ncbi:SEC-C domain-containing protein [Peribacillus sp. Hz7]|uniref:SEC-C domain-containing protein n=1 Tax=Peribacillus sp. Hz7 TaxID=3344873 RepID=UPI0035CAD6E6
MYLRTSKNQPCPCGSGLKYKKCCLEKDQHSEELKEIKRKKEKELQVKLDKHNQIKVAKMRKKLKEKLYTPYKNLIIHEEDLLIPSHNLTESKKSFVLALLEQLIYELKKESPSDKIIQCLSSKIFFLSDKGNLTETEFKLAKTPTTGNLAEYVQLPDGAKPDYNAMRVMSEFAYQAILEGISDEKKYWSATIFVDTNDTLVKWEFHSSENDIPLLDEIFVSWKSLDPLDNEYKILINKLYAFEKESLKTLATITTQMKFIQKKQSDLISYTSITMGYLGVLEQELRHLISLYKTGKQKRMMLREICGYLKDKNIGEMDRQFISRLETLIPLRNRAAHGEFISKDEFQPVQEILLNGQGYEIISWAKLDLKRALLSN